MPAQFNPKHFKRVFRAILRSGSVAIPKNQREAVEQERSNGRKNPYLGHCAQATAAAWVLGKELYKRKFDFKPYRSPDGSHYWLAKPTKTFRAKDRLDLTEHSSDPDFDYRKRNVPGWITRKSNRGHLESFNDAVKIYDSAKMQLGEKSK